MAGEGSPLHFQTQTQTLREQQRLGDEIARARIAAHDKHGAQSIEGQNSGNRLLPILLEEVGEVARAMNEYALGNLTHEQAGRAIRAELVDVLTVASAWAVKFDREDADQFPTRL